MVTERSFRAKLRKTGDLDVEQDGLLDNEPSTASTANISYSLYALINIYDIDRVEFILTRDPLPPSPRRTVEVRLGVIMDTQRTASSSSSWSDSADGASAVTEWFFAFVDLMNVWYDSLELSEGRGCCFCRRRYKLRSGSAELLAKELMQSSLHSSLIELGEMVGQQARNVATLRQERSRPEVSREHAPSGSATWVVVEPRVPYHTPIYPQLEHVLELIERRPARSDVVRHCEGAADLLRGKSELLHKYRDNIITDGLASEHEIMSLPMLGDVAHAVALHSFENTYVIQVHAMLVSNTEGGNFVCNMQRKVTFAE
jgi:hypothetical protein